MDPYDAGGTGVADKSVRAPLSTYKVIDKPSRIEYEHGDCPVFYTTVIFEDLGNQTRLSMRMLFRSQEERDDIAERYGAIEGLNQTLGRLEEFIAAK